MVTHLFNAQRGIHHREPGVAGQALADERLACGLILDGHHVAEAVARVAFAAARRADRAGHATRSPPPGCRRASTSSAASR